MTPRGQDNLVGLIRCTVIEFLPGDLRFVTDEGGQTRLGIDLCITPVRLRQWGVTHHQDLAVTQNGQTEVSLIDMDDEAPADRDCGMIGQDRGP